MIQFLYVSIKIALYSEIFACSIALECSNLENKAIYDPMPDHWPNE